MSLVHRVLPPEPITSLDHYLTTRGGRGLEAARRMGPDDVVSMVDESGLRGRGGGGFPTGRKWRTVLANRSAVLRPTVVVNGAEGEPGTFKDRTLLRLDPYRVLEGALIAAFALGADEVVVALKRTFRTELERTRAALAEMEAAGWTDGVKATVFEGPSEYLYGEETALLEALDGRMPFPRIAPPYRRGIDEVVETSNDLAPESGLPAHVEMAAPADSAVAPPTLVNNVETLANVPGIVSRGAAWFRTEGTEQSPGTIVCTVTGTTRRHGVGEVIMGTPLREVIELIGGGARDGRRITGVVPGVANALITEDQLDTPVSYEDLAAIGSGLGSAGFMVFDDSVDPAAVVAGVSRFLAIESCGQCTPCKQDGLALADELAQLCRSDGDAELPVTIRSRASTVADEARCYLATQHQVVVDSLLSRFPAAIEAHAKRGQAGVAPVLVSELVDIVDGEAVWDERYPDKQPDWTYEPEWSGSTPVDLAVDHRAEHN